MKIFFADKKGYHGMKCVEVGKTARWLERFIYCESALDQELKTAGWVPAPLDEVKKEKVIKNQSLS